MKIVRSGNSGFIDLMTNTFIPTGGVINAISDTTIIASLAAGCDHIDHVRTQMPYALVTGGLAVALYLIAGALVA